MKIVMYSYVYENEKLSLLNPVTSMFSKIPAVIPAVNFRLITYLFTFALQISHWQLDAFPVLLYYDAHLKLSKNRDYINNKITKRNVFPNPHSTSHVDANLLSKNAGRRKPISDENVRAVSADEFTHV